MKTSLKSERYYFDAFIKTAQYLATLTTYQDIWIHIEKIIKNFYDADLFFFFERGINGKIKEHQNNLSNSQYLNYKSDIFKNTIAQILENGFIALESINTPDPYALTFLPISKANQIMGVMIIGHKRSEPLQKNLLNIYLALAGLIGTTIERLSMVEELRNHHSQLEELVKERTIDLIKSQEQLYRKEKLATIGKIAGSIGHEIRNPLGVISNSTYFLNIKLKDSDGKVKKHLNILQREILRVNEIISDLLDFARIKQPVFKEVDINIFIKDILENFKFPENIILKKHLDAELPRIQIDSNQIQQAFQNIILNAIQAMPEGGKLEIKTLTSENTVEIVFKDTGVGIPRENLQKIFEPLFTTKARGIGLGLSIVKDIVESHNGMIYVESEVDVGTSFTVKLPILRKEEM